MSFSAQQLNQLYQPINPKRVATRQGKFSYLETWDVIAHLTRIFGFMGWSKTVESELLFEEEKGGKWTVAYRAKCQLTIFEPEYGKTACVHEDVATGSAVNQPSRADAHDLALKTAVSDALKRAAKDLGNQFGLSLYDDGKTDSVVGRSLADSVPNPLVAQAADAAARAQGVDPDKVRERVAEVRDKMLGEREIGEADAAAS